MEEEKKLLLKFGCHKKIVTLGRGVDNVRSFLESKAMELFNVTGPVVLQYMDPDFEEWVDMEEDYIPGHKEKLMIITKQPDEPATKEKVDASETTVTLDDNGMIAEPEDFASTLEEYSPSSSLSLENSSDLASVSSSPPSTISKRSMFNAVTKTAETACTSASLKKPRDDKNQTLPPVIVLSDDEDNEIPDPFPFPKTYSTSIDVALRTGKMNSITTAKFYTRISGVMAMYKRYPKREDYDRVAREIVRKYSFLRSPISGHSHIIRTLQDRFREIRRNRLSDKVSVVRKLADSPLAPKPKKSKLSGPTQLQVPEGEDGASFARHNRALKAEHKKVKPNRAVVKELMNMSYEMRRNDILSQAKPLVQLLGDYPFLGDYDELLAELGRNQSNPHVRADFLQTWEQQWLPKLVELVKVELTPTALKRLKPVVSDVETDFDMTCFEALTVKIMCALTYIVKDHKMKPDHDRLFTFSPVSVDVDNAASEVAEPGPTLLIMGQLGEIKEVLLIVEQQVVCKVKPREAPLCLLATFYAFNMTYPKGLENFYLLLEILVLDKPAKKLPSVLTRLLTQLSNV